MAPGRRGRRKECQNNASVTAGHHGQGLSPALSHTASLPASFLRQCKPHTESAVPKNWASCFQNAGFQTYSLGAEGLICRPAPHPPLLRGRELSGMLVPFLPFINSLSRN